MESGFYDKRHNWHQLGWAWVVSLDCGVLLMHCREELFEVERKRRVVDVSPEASEQ